MHSEYIRIPKTFHPPLSRGVGADPLARTAATHGCETYEESMRGNERSNYRGNTLCDSASPNLSLDKPDCADGGKDRLTLKACARTNRRAAYFGGPSTEMYELAATSSVAIPLAVTNVKAINL